MYDLILATRGKDSKAYDLIRQEHPYALWLPGINSLGQAMKDASKLALTEMFWLVTDELLDAKSHTVDFTWKPDEFDRVFPHRWQAREESGILMDGFRGLYLIPRSYEISDAEIKAESLDKVKPIDSFDIVVDSFDVFFISYDEKYADRNFTKLKRRFPRIRRVHGIEGIANAHRYCAESARSSMFWTIDADTDVDADFDFLYEPKDYDRKYLHVWQSRNPVNGLAYGWGAIKLWPRDTVLEYEGNWLDYTTSAGELKLMPNAVATTAFNSDPYRTWRSGFREAVKLARNIGLKDDEESLDRLHTWCTVARRVPHASDATRGANDGLWYYLDGKEPLNMINDFPWLRTLYMTKDKRIHRSWETGSIDKQSLLEMIRGRTDV